jgi:EpsI family protein
VFIIILAGHLTNMQHFLVKVDHYYFGWVLFAFTLVFYFWASRRIERRDETAPAPAPGRASASGNQVWLGVALAAAGLMLGPAWATVRAMEGTTAGAPVAPPVVAGWTGPDSYDSWWHPLFARADEEFQAGYRSAEGAAVTLYRAAYYIQRQGRELIGHDNSVMGDQRSARRVAMRRVAAGGREVEVSEWLAAGNGAADLLVWSVYALDGYPDRMGLVSRLLYGLESLRRFPTASVVAMASECVPDCDTARRTLESFAVASLPTLLPGIERNRTAAAYSGQLTSAGD